MRWDVPGAVLGVLSQSDGRYHGPHMMGGWWWMWILWIAGFFILVLVIYLLAYGSRNGGPTGPPPETPLDILKRRYARGEITREEYERMKRNLEG